MRWPLRRFGAGVAAFVAGGADGVGQLGLDQGLVDGSLAGSHRASRDDLFYVTSHAEGPGTYTTSGDATVWDFGTHAGRRRAGRRGRSETAPHRGTAATTARISPPAARTHPVGVVTARSARDELEDIRNHPILRRCGLAPCATASHATAPRVVSTLTPALSVAKVMGTTATGLSIRGKSTAPPRSPAPRSRRTVQRRRREPRRSPDSPRSPSAASGGFSAAARAPRRTR